MKTTKLFIKPGVLGLILIALGIAAGLYVGLYLMLYGGIMQAVGGFASNPIAASEVAIGIIKVMFASPTGIVTAWLFFLPAAIFNK